MQASNLATVPEAVKQPPRGRRTLVGLLVVAVVAAISAHRAHTWMPVVGLAVPEVGAVPRAERRAAPAPDVARRVLVVLGLGLGDADPGPPRAWPEGITAQPILVSGPADASLAEAAFLSGFDPSTYLPASPVAPPVSPAPTLVDSTLTGPVELHFAGLDSWLEGRRFRLGSRERGLADLPPEEALARLGGRLARTFRPPPRELWLVALRGEGAPPHDALRGALRGFLNGGARAQSLAFYLPMPGGRAGGTRFQARGLMVGLQPPREDPPELELEELAPTLALALGFPEPAGAKGAPRLDLVAARDPRGAYACLAATLPAAAKARPGVLDVAARLAAASASYRAERPRAAMSQLLEARRALATAERTRRQALWRDQQGSRAQRAQETYPLMVTALASSALGLGLGWGTGAAPGALLGLALQATVLAGLEPAVAARGQRAWEVLSVSRSRPLALGLVLASLGVVPLLVLAVLGRAGRGAGAAAYLVMAGPWLLALAGAGQVWGGGVPPFLADPLPLVVTATLAGTVSLLPLPFLLAELPLRVLTAVGAAPGPATPQPGAEDSEREDARPSP